jgi:hypothetical protein
MPKNFIFSFVLWQKKFVLGLPIAVNLTDYLAKFSHAESDHLGMVVIGGALVRTTVSNFVYVYGTYFRLTPILPSPIFDPHCSALFCSITEKIESLIPSKTQYLIINCEPPHKILRDFHNAVTQGQHQEMRLHCLVFYVPALR